MAQVLDYSAGFPGGLNIARPRNANDQQKFIGAARYIGLPNRRKCATRAELEDFSRAGLGMALVFEEAAGNWRKGFQQGQWDAQRARDHANAIGFPIGRPIYMAIDEDVVTPGEFTSMLEYLRGAHGPLGGSRLTGVYGEADVVDRARDAGVATWIWQTKAWSRGRLTTAHLRQLIGTVTVGGIACDVNDVLTADWGQHNYLEVNEMTWGSDTTQKQIDDMQARIASMHAGKFLPWPGIPDAPGGTLQWLDDKLAATREEILAGVRAQLAPLTDDEANIVTAIRAQPASGQPSAEQMDALAARLTAALGPALAGELGRRLSQS